MSLADLDLNFIKSISSLHSNEFFINGEPSILQLSLEEAIKSKTGIVKDFSSLIATSVKQQKLEEFKTSVLIEDSKTTSSSDNELELDLLKEDLMCVVCNGMDVGARNRLLECSDCHALYHQECHRPVVSAQEADESWICQNCKDTIKRLKRSPSSSVSPLTVTTISSSSKPVISKSMSGIHHAVSAPSNTTALKYSSKSGSNRVSSSTSSKPSSSKISNTMGSRTTVTPNINIISVDKRIQIMKKKAAKQQQEKRKLPR